MPDIVAKITHADGTESSFGPLPISKEAARDITRVLDPLEAKRQEQIQKDRVAEIEADQERRSKEASEHNQRQIKAASEGTK